MKRSSWRDKNAESRGRPALTGGARHGVGLYLRRFDLPEPA
ncbi:hypothetical protein [Paraburkholderia sp. WP4_3_2]|nr:hypothetical protein [Paraburkholderia sp. WP4_3_2]